MDTADNVGLVFGRRSLRMPSRDEVEVRRESARPGERRHYSKRFLVGPAGDLSPWTARERRILEQLGRIDGAPVARLLPVPAMAGAGLHTFDAGPTVDQWSTRVLLSRGGLAVGNVFEDCACWWALARRCLIALDKLHAIGFVHLDLKADNLCIPWSHLGEGDYPVPGQPLTLHLEQLAFIDVAFSLLPGVPLPGPLPLDREPHYEYQSQRLLEALEQGRRGNAKPASDLDWRCDLFSLAAMLWQYLPKLERSAGSGWTPHRHAQGTALVRLLVDADAGPLAAQRPHAELIVLTEWRLREPELAAALQAGYTFEAERTVPGDGATPLTRIFRPAGAGGAVAASAPASAPYPSPLRQPRQADPARLDPSPSAQRPPAHSQPNDLRVPDSHPIQAVPIRAPLPLSTPVEPVPRAVPPGPSDAGRSETTPPSRDPRRGSSGRRRAPVNRAAIVVATVLGVVAAVAWWGDRSGRLAVPWRSPAVAAAGSGSSVPSLQEPRIASNAQLEPSEPAASDPPPAAALTAEAPEPARSSTPAGSEAAAELPLTDSAAASPDVAPAPSRRQSSSVASGSSVGSDAASLPDLPRREAGGLPVEIFLPSAPRPASSAPARLAKADGQERLVGGFDDVGRQLMHGPIPGLAAGAERQLAPALATAGKVNDASSATHVRAAARAARRSAGQASLPVVVATQQARRLNEAARVAYWQRHNVPDAVELQISALGANPFDTEVVGNLAFLRLRQNPPQAESARALALHALTLKDERFPAGRVEDWSTLAIANALTGRDVDARNAWFVTMAISNDLERHCKAAVRAQAIYGDKLRSSVQAMLNRARSSPGYSRCGDRAERASRGSAGRGTA